MLKFREYAVAVSGDIKAMFHKVCLLPDDRALLRFVWHDMRREDPPDIFEWQVLPFSTTCTPCCTTFVVQKHVSEHSIPGEDVRFSIERYFYVDCLHSLPNPGVARQLVDRLRELLSSGGVRVAAVG